MPRNENQKNRRCDCGGTLESIGVCKTSKIDHCVECHDCTLEVATEFMRVSVPLALYFKARVDVKNETSFNQVMSAPKQLFHNLVMDTMPDELIGMLFGIESEKHLGTLQQLLRAGITEVELDRVMGDGHAITALAKALPHNPYGDVEFRTPFDEFRHQMKPAQGLELRDSLEREL